MKARMRGYRKCPAPQTHSHGLLVVGSHLLLILLLKTMWYPTFPNREHLSPHGGYRKCPAPQAHSHGLLVVGSHLLLILLLKATSMWYPTFPNREHLMAAEQPAWGVQKMSSTPNSFSWPARRRKPPASQPPLESYVIPNVTNREHLMTANESPHRGHRTCPAPQTHSRGLLVVGSQLLFILLLRAIPNRARMGVTENLQHPKLSPIFRGPLSQTQLPACV